MSDTTRVRVTTLLLILAASILAWPVFAERPDVATRASPNDTAQAPSRARK